MTRKFLVNREQRLLKRERDVNPDDLNAVKLDYEPAGTAADEIAAHVSASDPHTQYVQKAGNETIAGQKTFSDFITSDSYIQSKGALSGFQFFDRTNAAKSWVWYSTGGFCYLFRGFGGPANVLSIDDTNDILSDIYGRVRSVPVTTQNANYTFTVQDIGRCRAKTDTTARTYTVDNSIFSAGDVLTVLNDNSTANITIAAGAGVTLYLAGTTTTGSRTVAPRGIATIFMASASVGYVSGPGVT